MNAYKYRCTSAHVFTSTHARTYARTHARGPLSLARAYEPHVASRAREQDLGTVGDASEAEPSLVRRTIDVLGTVLTYNFFIICAFFLWFLTGVGAQYGAQNDAIIQAFRGAWDYIIQPLLGTHMLLTFISAGLERMVKE
eukprot:6179438-Pleurochrysis_carterae.AAC.2